MRDSKRLPTLEDAGLEPAGDEPPADWSAWWVYAVAGGLAVLGYALAFGFQIYGQFPLSVHGSAANDQNTVQDYADLVTGMVVTAVLGIAFASAAVCIVRSSSWRTRALQQLRPTRSWWCAASVPFTVLWCAQGASTLLGWSSFDSAVNDDAVWFSGFSATYAGVTEEVVALAAPAIVMTSAVAFWRLRAPTWPILVLVVLTGLRMAYHLYYGQVAVLLVPWAIASAVAFLRWRAVVPMIVMHALYDFSSFIRESGHLSTTVFVLTNLGVLAALIVGGLVAHYTLSRPDFPGLDLET